MEVEIEKTEDVAPKVEVDAFEEFILGVDSKQSELTNDEPKNEEIQVEVENEPTKDVVAKSFDILTYFKEKKGVELENEEQLDELLSRARDYDSIADKAKKHDELLPEYEKYKKYIELAKNPRSHFASDEDYKLNQLKIKNPNLNAEVLNRVVGKDLNSLDTLEISKLGYLLDKKGRGVSDAEMMVKEDILGDKFDDFKDEPVSEWPKNKQLKLEDYANSAREKLSAISTNIEDAKDFDFEGELISQKKKQEETVSNIVNSWSKAKDAIYKDNVSVKVKDLDFLIDEEYRKAIPDLVVETAKSMGVMPSEQVYKSIKETIQSEYLWANKEKLFTHAIDDAIAKLKESELNKKSNPSGDKTKTHDNIHQSVDFDTWINQKI
jgi:hypothetical protein